mmetsp:Transcript_48011/g.86840  ORF Transcript_48011/g.86840 Transcript_48011/m.86840 type:complete len:921 (+) Transcript_48011:93-2855(+)
MRLISFVFACFFCRAQGRRVFITSQPNHDKPGEARQSSQKVGEPHAVQAFANLLLARQATAGWQTVGTGNGHSITASKQLANALPQQLPPLARTSVHQSTQLRSPPPVMQAFTFDAFNRDVFRILMDAQAEARALGATSVGTHHLLLAATMQKDDVQAALERAGVTKDKVRSQITGGKASMPGLGSLFQSKDELLAFANDTEMVLKASVQFSKQERSDELIAWNGVMLVMLKTDGCLAVKLLQDMNLNAANVADAIKKGKRELVGAGGSRKQKKKGDSTLAKCSVDLTQKARDGELDPLVGRDEEIKRAMQILVRRRKNNPVLIGDPGVGKTAIAEGLARLIVEEKVPPRLKDMRLLSLELGLLVADTKYRGEFEQRIKDVIEEVTASNDTILFIDEIHTLVGAGAADGAIDAANLMKPALARGELQCMGATTIAEYRKYIEKDAALERRFAPVNIDEPSIEQTVQILSILADRYSEHHQVSFTPESLEAMAKLSARYLPDRYLPDKAIDLMDEAGSLKQLDAFTTGNGMTAGEKVDEQDVARVVGTWTGIPVSKLTEDEAKSMLDFESNLHDRVIGQDFAVSAISRALRRASVGLRSPRKPVASMIFCGPTGVGKTELAKAVASLYYGDEKAMVRLDMSEYMESFATSRLTGPPPGYVGYEEGGQLTGAVRRKPHTVVLFDEVEKAHPDVFNVLLQVLDDGRLTDNKGRTVDFTNTMLILTSNVGSRKILNMAGATGPREEQYKGMRTAVKGELNNRFRPEFLNRLDEVIVFESLNPTEISFVAELMLKELIQRCNENDIQLSTTQKLTDALVEEGYSPKYGARPLRRAVQRLCEDAVAEALLEGFAKSGETLKIDHDGSENVILINQGGKQRKFKPMVAQGIEEDAPSGGPAVEVLPPEDTDVMTRIKPPKDFGAYDR